MKRFGSVGIAVFVVLAFAGWYGVARAADDAVTKKLVEYYRRKANVPPSAQVEVKDLKASPIKGAKTGTLSVGGRDTQVTISDDGRYVIFGELEDLSVDPFASVMKKISK